MESTIKGSIREEEIVFTGESIEKFDNTKGSEGSGHHSSAEVVVRHDDKRIKVCILQSSYEESAGQITKDKDPASTPEIYLSKDKYVWESVELKKSTAVKELTKLSKKGFDVYINLCDGAFDEDRAGIEVVQALEKLKVAYTGADVYSYDPSRERMKRAAIASGIDTPAWYFCKTEADIDACVKELSLPLITKHYCGYGSVGMTKDSKCTTVEAFKIEARRFIDLYGEVLVEEFIEGPEFTVLVAENPHDPLNPISYQPVQCSFPKGESFKHFDLKWVDFKGIAWQPVEDIEIDRKLRDMASKMLVTLCQPGYGRIDVRMDSATGRLMFLEMNPNCGIFYAPGMFGSADEILACDKKFNHFHFMETIIQSAMMRLARKQKPYVCKYTKSRKAWGLFATRDLKVGDVVQYLEEQPVYLVSKKHVEARWNAIQRKQFDEYCYPFNKEVYGMWSSDPDHWEPINHSCDPNVWLDGLNTVARRPIAAGEELCLDYATFCVDNGSFKCLCGSAECRGEVTGKEYLDARILAKYGDHVTAYIQSFRK